MRFRGLVGAKPVQDVSIDLVVDEVALENADVVALADRLEARGVEVCDYAVYPVECALVKTSISEGHAESLPLAKPAKRPRA